MAILSDAAYTARLNQRAVTEEMSNAIQRAYDIYHSPLLNTETDKGGWLFQVGVGQDCGVFICAGDTDIIEGMQSNPCEDAVSDSLAQSWLTTLYETWILGVYKDIM